MKGELSKKLNTGYLNQAPQGLHRFVETRLWNWNTFINFKNLSFERSSEVNCYWSTFIVILSRYGGSINGEIITSEAF